MELNSIPHSGMKPKLSVLKQNADTVDASANPEGSVHAPRRSPKIQSRGARGNKEAPGVGDGPVGKARGLVDTPAGELHCRNGIGGEGRGREGEHSNQHDHRGHPHGPSAGTLHSCTANEKVG